MSTAAVIAASEPGGGSALASWTPLYVIFGIFVGVVIALFVFGRRGESDSALARQLLRVPNALERLARIPGWAAATVGMALTGLLIAGEGFYSDVTWHVALGRDKELFTAPHTSIVIGLGMIFLSGAVGVLAASLQRVDTALRWRAVRIPWSTLPIFALGAAALAGFPLDELWHRAYGVDVTMWSPTHMLMILGASFTGLAAWLVLADAGVRPHDNNWSMGVHAVAAWLTLQGLAAPLGEFAFGVPQFQQMFHPLLLCIASGFAFVAMRLVLGRWWGLGIAVFNVGLNAVGLSDGPVETRAVGVFVASALAVELTALIVGVAPRLRFALLSGLGVGTVGLLGEWWWNQGAYQPWRSTLLPDAVILGVVAAVAASVLAVPFARAAGYQTETPRLRRPVVALAGLATLVVVALPLDRDTGSVSAAVTIGAAERGRATISVALDPPDAAVNARWFQATSWQGGGLITADFERTGAGAYESERPVPVGGAWKSLIRLHRGSELMTIPIFLPADPEIAEREIPAIDRTMLFQSETDYLLRETHPGGAGLKNVVYGLLLMAMTAWIVAFSVSVSRISPRSGEPRPTATVTRLAA